MVQVPKGPPLVSPSIGAYEVFSLGEFGAVKVGPSAASAAAPIPGVIERLNLLDGLRAPSDPSLVAAVIPEHHLFTFARETGMGAALMAPILRREVSYSKAVEGGLILNFLELAGLCKVIKEIERIEYIPIAEIHCPKVKGCKATYIHETKDQNDYFLNIKFLGGGGGGGKTISIGTGYSIPAEGDCRQVLIPAKLNVRQMESSDGKLFPSVDVVEILNGYKVSLIKERHFCKKDYRGIDESGMVREPYPIGEVSGVHKTSKLIDIGKKANFDWGIKFKEIDTEIGLNISVEVIRQVKYEYELAGGYDYIGYFPMPNSSIFCWTWKKGSIGKR